MSALRKAWNHARTWILIAKNAFAWVGLKPEWQIRGYNLGDEEACERYCTRFIYYLIMNKGMLVEIGLEETKGRKQYHLPVELL